MCIMNLIFLIFRYQGMPHIVTLILLIISLESSIGGIIGTKTINDEGSIMQLFAVSKSMKIL